MADGQVIFQDFGVQNMRQVKELEVHFNLYQMCQVGEIKILDNKPCGTIMQVLLPRVGKK